MTEMSQKQAYKIAEFCSAFGVGRSKAYEEISSKRLRVFKLGRSTLITRDAALDWLRRCEETPPPAKIQVGKRSAR